MAPLLKTNFFDQGEQDTLSIKQELPPGTSLGASDDAGQEGREDARRHRRGRGLPGHRRLLRLHGGLRRRHRRQPGLATRSSSRTSADSGKVSDDLRDGLDKLGSAIGDTTVAAGDGFGSQDLSVVVKAGDADVLKAAPRQVRDEVAELDDVTDVQSDLAQSVPRISVTANAKAAAAGYNDATLGEAVAQAVRGTTAGKAILDDTERDIVIKSAAARPRPWPSCGTSPSRRRRSVSSATSPTVKLVAGPVQMTRIDGARSATITAKPTGDNTGAVSADAADRDRRADLPDGATAEIGGVSQDQTEAFASLGLAMLAAIAIVFMLLVATFRSLVQPLILLVSIPSRRPARSACWSPPAPRWASRR